MAKAKATRSEFDEIVRRTAEEERRLLKRERRSEKRIAGLREEVAEAAARLAQAQQRLDRRNAALAEAERELAGHRAARARGPALALIVTTPSHDPNGQGSSTPLAPVPPADPATSG